MKSTKFCAAARMRLSEPGNFRSVCCTLILTFTLFSSWTHHEQLGYANQNDSTASFIDIVREDVTSGQMLSEKFVNVGPRGGTHSLASTTRGDSVHYGSYLHLSCIKNSGELT